MSAARAAIILAAGASRRMGSPKALLPWGNSTLLEYAVQQARAAGVVDLAVVLGPATAHLTVDAQTVVNPEPETGRSASIRFGAGQLRDGVGAIAVQSVDQPVAADVLVALFAAVEGGAHLAVPTFGGRRGHPLCCAGRLLGELRDVREEDLGLRAVVRRHSVTEVPVDTESVVWNLNDPAAYAAARAAQ
jgi:molybdenum cofactor cytidylyltransferase